MNFSTVANFGTTPIAGGISASGGATTINVNIVVNPAGDTGLGAGPDVQDTFFIGSNSHVYQLRWNGSNEIQRDLNVASGGPAAASNSGLTSFTLSNGSHAVYYIDGSQHVRELFWNTVIWTNGDLTAASGGPTAVSGSALTSVTSAGPGHSVYYFDTNHHVNELNWNGSAWHNGDLTAASGTGTVAAAGSPISSFIASSGGINVFYLSSTQRLNQLNFNLSSWNNADLITLGSGTTALISGGLSSNLASSGGYNAYYVGTDQHIHQMNFNLSTFHDNDVTAASHGTLPLTTSALSSTLANSGGINVYFVGTDQHIHQDN